MVNRELVNPKSIVVIGASENIKKPGGKVLYNILLGDYKGKLYAINPKEEKVQGVKCVAPEDLPDVELAIISVAVNHVKGYIEFLAKNKKTKAFIVLSAGFGEMGEEGKKLEKEILDVINKYNASLIGPNCIGVLTQGRSPSWIPQAAISSRVQELRPRSSLKKASRWELPLQACSRSETALKSE